MRAMRSAGRVYLVGSGPGDPDLLTVKAARLLTSADVIVYDRLVSEEILALVPDGVTRLFVGKTTGNHHLPQDEINHMLVRLAESGHQVVRLKGGDPFVFGRGGEEALHLARHGIAFEVVPGVTAAVACAAYAGIPITHRGLATGVRLVTGHCRGDRPLDLDWEGLADPDTTLVVYMGLENLPELAERLVGAGLARETPAALVESGTTGRQRSRLTTLGALPQAAREHRMRAPTLIVIGRVAALSEQLGWFEETAAGAVLEARGHA
jgi:uroporphyrin-III C-methyltransferase/precorrin-2 dehydrogenase/sirohydrochlorin ferrochelatase/uroporphyrin-III C-methyltransferase